ncbi:hypothetical protein GT50_08455 [Geobacillus stearothermophilus 10]|nr:hypothetical protein GT50_08455 [Geobacillus stearothermophilus 10]
MPLLFFCAAGFVWKGGDALRALRRKAPSSNVCFPPSMKVSRPAHFHRKRGMLIPLALFRDEKHLGCAAGSVSGEKSLSCAA